MDTAEAVPNAKMLQIRRAGAIGNFIEYFDNALYAYFAVTIATLFFPAGNPTAALLSTFALFGVAFFIRPLGGIFFGYIGDWYGRRKQLIFAILLMSVSTALIGVLPTYASVGVIAPLLLLVCRLLQGFSVGGESTGAFVLVVEQSPVHDRPRNASPLVVTTILGAAAAAVLAAVVSAAFTPEQVASFGWRLPFFVALPLGIVGLVLRMRLGETEVFQKAVAEVEQQTAHRRAGSPLKVAIQTSGREMLVLFGWVALSAVVGYITVAYMVAHLRTFVGYAPQTALLIFVSALLVAAVAQVFLGRLAERFGRRRFAMLISGALAVLVIPVFLSLSISPVVATVALAIFASFQYAAMIVSGCAMVELFPVDVRSSASGLAYSLAFSLFGGTVPFVATWLAADYGVTAPAIYAMIFAVVGFFIGWKALPEARSMDITSSGDTLGVENEAVPTTPSPAS